MEALLLLLQPLGAILSAQLARLNEARHQTALYGHYLQSEER
jgi:hypothetical protein